MQGPILNLEHDTLTNTQINISVNVRLITELCSLHGQELREILTCILERARYATGLINWLQNYNENGPPIIYNFFQRISCNIVGPQPIRETENCFVFNIIEHDSHFLYTVELMNHKTTILVREKQSNVIHYLVYESKFCTISEQIINTIYL